jgi:hypothetical protein
MSTRSLALFVVAAILVTGCERRQGEKDVLEDALYRTETLPRTFDYRENFDVLITRITGTIADDYRYHARATVDGQLGEEVVVVDDARAFRLGKAYGKTPAGRTLLGVAEQNTVQANLPISALATGKWLVDPKGANTLFAGTTKVGAQIIRSQDALESLKYVRRAMGEAQIVLRFNPDSQEYRPKFDPFPKPADDEVRYDVIPPVLTPRDPTTSSGNALQLPGVRYFRRMAVYVTDGLVRQVRERISIEDFLRDPRSRLAARIGDYDIALPPSASVGEQASYLERVLNESATRLSQPLIRVRDMRVTFSDLGSPQVVHLPKDVTRGSLEGFDTSGQFLYERPG